jgi:hypothetical protein
MKRYLLVSVASVVWACSLAALAAEIGLIDEEKALCEKQGGCLFTSAGFVRERLQAAYEAGFQKGRAKACGLEA